MAGYVAPVFFVFSILSCTLDSAPVRMSLALYQLAGKKPLREYFLVVGVRVTFHWKIRFIKFLWPAAVRSQFYILQHTMTSATKATEAQESQDKYNYSHRCEKPKVEPLANNKSSVDPLLPAPHLSRPSQPTQTQLDDRGDSEDHVLISMSDVQEDIPEIGGIKKPTKAPDQSPISKKRAPRTPTKPAHLRGDSKATAYPPLAFATNPTAPQSNVADSGVNAVHVALPPPPRRKPAIPVKHEEVASLPPRPNWAKPSPSSESTHSSWKEMGKAVLSRIPPAVRNLPGNVSDTVKSVTQSHPSFVIAIMGVTGSGKSQFIKHVTGKDVGVSNSLNSCKR